VTICHEALGIASRLCSYKALHLTTLEKEMTNALLEADSCRSSTPVALSGCLTDSNSWSKLNLNRNRVSLGIRCRWGIRSRNALYYVAKDGKTSNSGEKDKVLGVAMWMSPRPVELKETWDEWWEGWKLWSQQVGMNLWYGRGGLNVKVREFRCP
jgi:hypothetical protein